MQTAVLDVRTPDGVADAYLVHPGGGGSYPAVLFFMDAIGLRPRLFEMADRIAANGYVVLVPNVFYRHGRAPLVDDLPDLLRPQNRPKLIAAVSGFVSSLTPDAAMRDAGAYLDFLAGQGQVAPGLAGITGYCMGGALALRTAGSFPERVAAAASFHGGNLATEATDSPHRLADCVRAELTSGTPTRTQGAQRGGGALPGRGLPRRRARLHHDRLRRLRRGSHRAALDGVAGPALPDASGRIVVRPTTGSRPGR